MQAVVNVVHVEVAVGADASESPYKIVISVGFHCHYGVGLLCYPAGVRRVGGNIGRVALCCLRWHCVDAYQN